MIKIAQIEKALEVAFGKISKTDMFKLSSYQLDRIQEDYEENGYADIDLEFGNEWEDIIDVEVNCELSSFGADEPTINTTDITIAEYNEKTDNYDIILTYDQFLAKWG